jgi:hypothetical protein
MFINAGGGKLSRPFRNVEVLVAAVIWAGDDRRDVRRRNVHRLRVERPAHDAAAAHH